MMRRLLLLALLAASACGRPKPSADVRPEPSVATSTSKTVPVGTSASTSAVATSASASAVATTAEPSAADAGPPPALTADETRLAQLLAAYPRDEFDKDPKVPPPGDPWKGKVLRFAGRVRSVWGEKPVYAVIAPSFASESALDCSPPTGSPKLAVGARVVIEGKVAFETTAPSFKGIPNNPLAEAMTRWRLDLHLRDCKLLSSKPRSFGVSAKTIGMPIEYLHMMKPHKAGERVAVQTHVTGVYPGRLTLQTYGSTAECLGPPARLQEISYGEYLSLTAKLAGADGGLTVFEDCQPLDE